MPTESATFHADLLRRLDQLPIGDHERRLAKSNATIAFGIVDAIADAIAEIRQLFAPRRQATRAS